MNETKEKILSYLIQIKANPSNANDVLNNIKALALAVQLVENLGAEEKREGKTA